MYFFKFPPMNFNVRLLVGKLVGRTVCINSVGAGKLHFHVLILTINQVLIKYLSQSFKARYLRYR